MGADARWVCHTCRTVCARGGTPIFKSMLRMPTLGELRVLKTRFCDLMEVFNLAGDHEERYTSFLDDLLSWLSRHDGHVVHIGSDYSTDMMNLGNYHDETVDGTVSQMTRDEVDTSSIDQWTETSIRSIQSLIEKCIAGEETPRAAAENLFNREMRHATEESY